MLVLFNQEMFQRSVTDIKRMFFDSETGEDFQKEPRNKTLTSKKANTRCFGCNEVGHFKNKCPLMKKFIAKEKEKYQKKKKNPKRTIAMMTKTNTEEGRRFERK